MVDKKLWRNRREKKEWARRLQSEDPGLTVVHPQAAGIDVGNNFHYVLVRHRAGSDRTFCSHTSPCSISRIASACQENWMFSWCALGGRAVYDAL